MINDGAVSWSDLSIQLGQSKPAKRLLARDSLLAMADRYDVQNGNAGRSISNISMRLAAVSTEFHYRTHKFNEFSRLKLREEMRVREDMNL